MTEPVMTDTPSTPPIEPDRGHERDGAPSVGSGIRASAGAVGRALRAVGGFLRRWRAPLVLLPLLVGLGYVALLGARMLWEEVPSPPPEPRSVTCWDGSESPRVDCAAPAGAAGLHWVFPSFRPKADRCIEVLFPDEGGPRPTQFDCTQRLQGSSVTVSYSQRSTVARGQSYFNKRYPGIEPREAAGGDRLTYRDAAPRSDGTFEVTETYTAYPYAVTASATSLALADAALDQLVTFRPAAFVIVRPVRPVRPTS